MRKIGLFMVLIFLFSACKEKIKDAPSQAGTKALSFSGEELPKSVNINRKASAILEEWAEFKAFDTSFDALRRAENREDLILVIEDLVEKQKELASSEYPEPFNKSQIRSRQKVLKTYILKAKAALEYRVNVQEPTAEMVAAYNAFRNQFNVTINNVLDAEVIFEE